LTPPGPRDIVFVGMSEDYPRTLLELEQRFSRDEACAGYLASVRWPAGWVCPRCAGEAGVVVRRARWRCGQCRYEMSVTAGTIFQDSHLPLTTWFRAMWHVTSQKNGISALDYSGFWAWAATKRLGHAPQVAAGDGSSGPRALAGHRGGGRNVLGRRGSRYQGSAHAGQGPESLSPPRRMGKALVESVCDASRT